MSRKHSKLEEALFFWLEPLATKVAIPTVVFTDQDAPQPPGDFLAVDITRTTTDARPEKIMDLSPQNANQEILETLVYRGIIELTIRTYAKENSFQKAEEIKTRIWGIRSVDRMSSRDIGIHTVGGVRDSTFLEEVKTRQRADIPVTIHYSTIYDDLIESIGHAPVRGETDLGDTIIDEIISEP